MAEAWLHGLVRGRFCAAERLDLTGMITTQIANRDQEVGISPNGPKGASQTALDRCGIAEIPPELARSKNDKGSPNGEPLCQAEGGGFEPPMTRRPYWISNPARSTALPPLRRGRGWGAAADPRIYQPSGRSSHGYTDQATPLYGAQFAWSDRTTRRSGAFRIVRDIPPRPKVESE